jgi:spore coat protein CotF
MYQQQSQMNRQQSVLQDQDVANIVLSECKRIAREYATAALEANHPAIRQTFQTLLQKTLQDQAQIYTIISQMNAYGDVKEASWQEIQQEIQKQMQKVGQLQTLVQQSLQWGLQPQAAAYQQPMNQPNNQPAYAGNQSYSYNQAQGSTFASGAAVGKSAQDYSMSTAKSSDYSSQSGSYSFGSSSSASEQGSGKSGMSYASGSANSSKYV